MDELGKGRLNIRRKSNTMKTKICLLGFFALVTLAIAAPHTWILITGKTVTGDYFSSGITTLVVKTGGTNCFIKLSDLSANDQAYVAEIQARIAKNPPQPGDIRYYSPILGVWTNAASIFQIATALSSRGNSSSPLDISEAKDLFVELATAGYVPAEIKLGEMASLSVSSYNQAASWYQMAAERGSAEAQCKLAHLFQFNAMDWIHSGHYRMGIANEVIRYYNSPRIEEAANWYGMAAAQGDRRGKIGLAELYSFGSGVSQNVPEAIKLFEECECYLQIADLLRTVNSDHAEIYKWWRIGKIRGSDYLPHLAIDPTINSYSRQDMQAGEQLAMAYLLKRYNTTKPVVVP